MALTNKGNFIINNKYEFSPKSLNLKYESLASENSGRTQDGVMNIYWIFNKIRKLEIELAPCTSAEVARVFSLVQGQEYYITYWDVNEDQEKTIFVYTSNSSADCYSGYVRHGLYQGAKFNAIEIAGENTGTTAPMYAQINRTSLYIEKGDSDAQITLSNGDLTIEDENATYSIEDGNLYREKE